MIPFGCFLFSIFVKNSNLLMIKNSKIYLYYCGDFSFLIFTVTSFFYSDANYEESQTRNSNAIDPGSNMSPMT